MSSLAGALDDIHSTRDVDMNSKSEDEDEHMSDLFGNDNDVVDQRFV